MMYTRGVYDTHCLSLFIVNYNHPNTNSIVVVLVQRTPRSFQQETRVAVMHLTHASTKQPLI